MSIELDWTGLEKSFADSLCERLNAALADMDMPTFLGPTQVQAIELGSEGPDVQVIHIGHVWREFREAAVHASSASDKYNARAATPPRMPMRLRTFRQYDDNDMPTSVHGGADADSIASEHEESLSRWSDTESETGTCDSSSLWEEQTRLSDIPSLQMHLSVQWLTSTMRLSLTTSLKIAYNNDTIMSLPISLVVTGMELFAQAIVALDGVHRCVYLSLSEDSTEECAPDGLRAVHDARIRTRHQGQRILSFLALESKIGESAKHVLENVGKVERFVGDMLRQWLEDELVYPHFYTLYL